MTRKQAGQRRDRRRIVDFAVDEDVRRELDCHLEMLADDLVAEGWSQAEARSEARRRLGDRRRIERDCRREERRKRTHRRRADMFDVLRQDLRFSLRQLARRPSFTVAALITLTLGIGAVSTMYTLVQGVLLYSLPYPDSERVVYLWERSEEGSDLRVSLPNAVDWKERATSFSAVAWHSGWPGDRALITPASGAVYARAANVSADFFRVLGVEPVLGRTFGEEESSLGGPPAAVVSRSFWQTHLGAPDDLEGITVRVAESTVPVVGVMPEHFDFPPDTEVWGNAGIIEDTSSRTAHNWAVIARLAGGVSLESARSEMSTIAQAIEAEVGEDSTTPQVTVRPIKAELVGSTRRPLLFLFGASALVLLLAATNLASSLLARAIEREGEITLRGALGAGSGRLTRQLLTESVVLTTLGGLLGTAFAYGALALLKRIDTRIPRLDGVEVDLPVLFTTLGIAAVTGLIFGLIPALRAARVDLRSSLSAARGGDRGRQRVWSLMVASEVALALVLLVGSLLLLSELWSLLARSTGFETRDIAAVDIVVPDVQFPDEMDPELVAEFERRIVSFHRGFTADLASQPGVEEVAYASYLPLGGSSPNGRICLVPRDCSADESLQGWAGYRLVSPGYFEVLGIPVLEGRAFRDDDSAEGEFVAVVNRTFADRYFPEGDAVGQRILSGGMDLHGDRPTRIVGVVGDVLHRGLDRDPTAEIFYPARQRAARSRYATYVVRSDGGAIALLGGLRDFLRRSHPDIPPEVATLESIRVESVADRRFALIVLSALALVALGLALTGIWAVVSYRVAQRRHEIGVRMALGLAPRGVLRLVLSDTARLLGAGILVGVLLSMAAVRGLASQIEALGGGSLTELLLAAAVLLAAGLVASWLPARRATRIEPLETLRSEA